jgi:hypothetical protein
LEKVLTPSDGIAEAKRYYTVKLDAAKPSSGVSFYKLQGLDRNDVKNPMVLT